MKKVVVSIEELMIKRLIKVSVQMPVFHKLVLQRVAAAHTTVPQTSKTDISAIIQAVQIQQQKAAQQNVIIQAFMTYLGT